MTGEVLQLLLTYCRYHRVPGYSDKERKAFDEKFIRLDTRRLCELTSAADRCAFGGGAADPETCGLLWR